MRYLTYHWVVFWLFTGVIVSMHLLLHNDLASFVIAPLAIAALLPFTMAESLWLLVSLLLIAELFSGLPVGIMSVAILVPFVYRRLLANTEPALSISFFLSVTLIVVSQLALVTVGLLLEATNHASFAIWQQLPLKSLVITFLVTSMIVFAAAVVWHKILLLQPKTTLRHRMYESSSRNY